MLADRRGWLLLNAVFWSCSSPSGLTLPAGAVPLQPPVAYRLWWSLTEACFGRNGAFESVRWYVVPGADQIHVGGQTRHGYWWGDGRIVLAEGALLDGALVRHEMLHALSGNAGHPEYFTGRCGGIVACSGECLGEAGEPMIPATAAELSLGDLDVRVRVNPEVSSFDVDSGWVAITVSAANPRQEPVWVELAPVGPGEPASSTFGIVVKRCDTICGVQGQSYVFVWAHRFGFPAGETRRLTFDRQLSPGRYEIRGHFNADTTGPVSVLVHP